MREKNASAPTPGTNYKHIRTYESDFQHITLFCCHSALDAESSCVFWMTTSSSLRAVFVCSYSFVLRTPKRLPPKTT